MLVDDLKDLRKTAELRKKEQLAKKRALEREKAKKAAAAELAKLAKEKKLKEMAEKRVEERRQKEFECKKRALEKDKQRKLREQKAEKDRKSEERDLARLQIVFLRRALKGYCYAKQTPLVVKRSKTLKAKGFRFVTYCGKDSEMNPLTHEEVQRKLRAQLDKLKKDSSIFSQSNQLVGLSQIQEQVLWWTKNLNLPIPYKFYRKAASDKLEYFRRSAEALLAFVDRTLEVSSEPEDFELKAKIDSISSLLGHLIDEQGNFKGSVLPTERQIAQRVGLEALKQKYALSIQSSLALAKAQGEVRKIPHDLLRAIRGKLKTIAAHEAHKVQVDRVESSLKAVAKQQFDCISWGEKPSKASSPSDSYLFVHWLHSRSAQQFVQDAFSYIRSRALRSNAKIMINRPKRGLITISMGRNKQNSAPPYVTAQALSTIFQLEGLDVIHQRISEECEEIQLSW